MDGKAVFIVADVGGGPLVSLAGKGEQPYGTYLLSLLDNGDFAVTRPDGSVVEPTKFYGDVDYDIGIELRLALRPATTWADLLVSNHTRALCAQFSLVKNRKVKAELLAHAPWAEVKKAVTILTEIKRLRIEAEMTRENTFVVAASELAADAADG